MFAYVGCYTTEDRGGRGEGIAIYRMDDQSGAWTHAETVTGIPNPSFLTLAPDQRFLYCVHGGNDFSAVSAFARDSETGGLTFLNRQQSGGANPVALVIEPTNRFVAVANYFNGTVGLLPIGADGTLGALRDLATQTGPPGPHPTEQTNPHPHDAVLDPAGRYLVIPDKGLDKVFIYRLDAERGALMPADPPSVTARPGAAPRHAAFHPHLPYAYVINEIDSTITTYAYDAAHGTLDERQVLSTLPPDFTGTSTTAEIAVAPSGRFLYGSNRGHDSIAIFAIDAATGTLTPLAWESTQGAMPRFFALDPSGNFLYAANQGSDTIVTFRVDRATGALAPTGQVVQSGSPVCIVFAE